MFTGRYLEAQIQGSKSQAKDGTLVILVAGDSSLFDDCQVIVCVESMEEEIFRKFLNHIYGEKVVVDELIGYESVMEMLVLVEKYNIKDMKEALLLRLKSQVVDEKTSWEL